MRKTWIIAAVIAAPFLLAGGAVGIGTLLTEREIAGHAAQVAAIGRLQPARPADPAAIAALPEPVQAYLRFALPGPLRPLHTVRLAQAGEFRRPLTEGFAPTTAEQTIAIGTPALMFAATTPLLPGLWARAYDFYAAGRMRMRAKILSTLGVVNEHETEALNRTSLRRWLLESPLYPMALLPGGPVRWEAVDARRARAVVAAHGLEASLVATFRADGSLERFDAEQDGDLTAPYHGSGEHVTRTDYRLVEGVMIPMGFVIARAAGGRIHPFWRGRVTGIVFE
ncbi:hypothetical protein HB662_15525 [Roseomonas frigidaquae]|uniref:Uncharacterized protein n=1 Tax=Falsiroseomonas frigidaquae TaxID=487318 RepID=A0ABX1F1H4_9PROT|nr:DUF6544 family protein [Falsiroseomonas frigidaquae]NKE46196.1 hypothetical protein [Falsiroseomonas frigidaquae]